MDEFQAKHTEILTYCKQGRFQQALETYHNFLVGRPQSARLLRWLADIYGMQGQLVHEAETLKSAISLDESCVAAHYSLCRNQLKSGELEESILAGKRVLELEEKDSDRPFSNSTHFIMAYAYKKLGRMEKLAELLEFVEEFQTEWLNGKLLTKSDLQSFSGHREIV